MEKAGFALIGLGVGVVLGYGAIAFFNMVGGEVPEYTQLMAQSREQALERMAEEARKLGAALLGFIAYMYWNVEHQKHIFHGLKGVVGQK